MIVRTPLMPCNSASHSISRSQVCQNGFVHLPAMKAKSTCLMPSPVTRFTNRWPNTRAMSSTPDPRMNSHEYSSKLLRVARLRRYWARGASMVVIRRSSGEDVHQVADDERYEEHREQPHDGPEHLPLVARPVRPEVNEDDADAVEGVEDHCGD